MKLVVGLGNPGEKYDNTRHNVGFIIIDRMVDSVKKTTDFQFDKKTNSEILKTNIDNESVILVKPQTFMNLSGESVQKLMQFYKIKPEDVWVVSDDLNLELGTVRIRKGGVDGGHNGLKSIINNIGKDFYRVRVGIGSNREAGIASEDYVLQKFSSEEKQKLSKVIDKTTDLLVESVSSGLEEQTIKI